MLLATARVLVLLGGDGALAYNNGLGRLPPMVWRVAVWGVARCFSASVLQCFSAAVLAVAQPGSAWHDLRRGRSAVPVPPPLLVAP